MRLFFCLNLKCKKEEFSFKILQKNKYIFILKNENRSWDFRIR
jgi:hypothetical protein